MNLVPEITGLQRGMGKRWEWLPNFVICGSGMIGED